MRQKSVRVCLLLAGLGFALPSPAVEDGAGFVDELRQRGLESLAAEYLEARQNSPLVTPEFRNAIPYEKGLLLIELAQRAPTVKEKVSYLEEAQAALNDFTESADSPELVGNALLELGRVQVGLGTAIQLADAIEGNGNSKLDAREMFEQAKDSFSKAEASYDDARQAFPKNIDAAAEPELFERRKLVRLRWLESRLLLWQAEIEIAQTFLAGSAEFRTRLQTAATELSQLFDKYARNATGGQIALHARFHEGRCYHLLEENEKAIEVLQDVTEVTARSPGNRMLVAKAIAIAMQARINLGQLAETVELADVCIESARAGEDRQLAWLHVRYLRGQAEAALAEQTSDRNQKSRMRRSAGEDFRFVSRVPSPYRSEAQQRYLELAKVGDAIQSVDNVGSFQEAFELGQEAIDQLRAARTALKYSQSNAPQNVPEIEETIDSATTDARRYLQRALLVVDADDPLEEINLARYYLSVLDYEGGELMRAAIMADFLARNYPDDQRASLAAKLALAAWQQVIAKLPGQASAASESFAARQLEGLATFVTRRWPNTEEAAAATGQLINLAIQRGDLQEAEAFLESVPAQQRIEAQCRLANALWSEYLRQNSAEEPSPDVQQLRDKSVQMLRASVDSAQQEANSPVTAQVATAALFLAQASIEKGQYDAALENLQHDRTGALTLLEGNASAAQGQGFAESAYRVALQAYILAGDAQSERAFQIMDQLEASYSQRDQESQRRLTKIYLGLGLDLQKRLQSLIEEQRMQEYAGASQTFEEFLSRLAERSQQEGWAVRNWVVEAQMELADTLADLDQNRAQQLYRQALASNQQLVQQAQQTEGYAPSANAILAARQRQGELLASTGQFREAMDEFTVILGEKPTALDVQRAAAKTYQQWGRKDPRRYENAIRGGRRERSTGQNRIWGWAKLGNIAARAARKDAKYRNYYFEAWYNAAYTRYLAADQDKEQLEQAKATIRTMYQLDEKLGGQDWYGQYEELLKKIQSKLSQSPVGLAEFATAS